MGLVRCAGEPDRSPIAAVKLLHVEPGQMLSLQIHAQRRERWTPITPGLAAIIGTDEIELQVGRSYDIGVGVPHRLFTTGSTPGTVVETMYGVYDRERHPQTQ